MSKDTTTTTEQESVQADISPQPEEPETQAVQAEEVSETSEADNQSTDQDDDILQWAEKKGLNTEDPKQLLKMVRESERKMHEATTEANALKSSVKEVSEDAGLDETSSMLNRLMVTEFYLNNPEAKKLDSQMAEIVTSKPYLANDLEVVYELAKAKASAVNTMAERQAGRKEALAQVAKAEAAQPPSTSASTRQAPKGYTDEDIAKMSLSEYEAFQQETGFNPFA